MKPEYVINGHRTTTLEDFYKEIGRILLAGDLLPKDLDGLHSLLHGDYGHVPDTFRLVWRGSNSAKQALGYGETVRQLLQQLRDCPPTSLIKTAWALRAALNGKGPTVYDWLLEAIRQHPNVELVLGETEDEG